MSGNPADSASAAPAHHHDWLRARLDFLPRPVRFLGVGVAGLIVDLGIFTPIPVHDAHPLLARAISLAGATFVTWRLNRALTFAASGLRQHAEALRYALVTATGQGASFAVFGLLVISVFARLPQAALLAGAVVGAGVGYAGHNLFAFAPGARATPYRDREGVA